jgi:hypothetical protein
VETALVLLVIAVVAGIAIGSLKAMSAANRSPLLNPRAGRWETAVHSLSTGGYQVVVQREGEPRQVVREIPPGLEGDELSNEIARARADADEHASALNAAGPPGFPRR